MVSKAVKSKNEESFDKIEGKKMPERLQELGLALSRLEQIVKKPKIVQDTHSLEQGDYINFLENENLSLSKKVKTVLTVQKALEIRCDELEKLLHSTENELKGAIHEIDKIIASDSVS